MSEPQTLTSPDIRVIRPDIALNKDDFPDPITPVITINSPFSIVK